MRKWLDDVDAHVYELLQHGHHVPGAKLVEPKPKREYHGSEEDVVKKLSALTGRPQADMYRQSVLPVTYAEKMVVEAYKSRVGRGKKKQAAEQARQAFAFLTTKQSSGKPVVADENDPRPALRRSAQTFQQIPMIGEPNQ